MITSLMAAVAALAVAVGPAQEPPPPPYDDVSEAQEFVPFYAIGPSTAPGVWRHIEPAVTPAEGRALCAHYQRWDMPGKPIDCLVVPLSEMPEVEQDGWLNDWSAQNGLPVVG